MKSVTGLLVRSWHRAVVVLGAIAAFAAGGSPAHSESVGRQAHRVRFTEVAKLRYHGEKGAAVVETGQGTGTYDAPLTAEMTLHATYVAASVRIYPHGGSITGTARASFKSVGHLLYFGGTFTLGRCTGRFHHLSEINGKPLGFSGILNRDTYGALVKANGEVNE